MAWAASRTDYAAPRPRRGIGPVTRAIARCRRGVAAVEFGLAAPVVFLAIAGLIDLSTVTFVQSLLEGALRDASRYGITGYVPAGTTREQRIRDIISEDTIGLVDVSQAHIEILVYPGFDDVGRPEPFVDANGNGQRDAGESYTDINGNGQWDADMGAAGAGGPGDVVLYRITYDWHVLTPLTAPFMGTDGTMTLTASVAVRNEPYGTPGLPGGGGGGP
jgi:TadE-like protein